jgi:hypothetical protein
MIGEPVCKFLSKLVHTITKRHANFTTRQEKYKMASHADAPFKGKVRGRPFMVVLMKWTRLYAEWL